MKNKFDTYYGAKFARDAKENPCHWLIIPDGGIWFKLIHIGV